MGGDMRHVYLSAAVILLLSAVHPCTAGAQGFSGGGASLYLGMGWPNSIDAVGELADALDLGDETGSACFGLHGFYQGDAFRLGGALQAHGWAGFSTQEQDNSDDAAGVAALIAGVYGTYTFRHDRVLLNVGAVAGAGRCVLGYDLEGALDDHSSVAVFVIEPLVSLGVAATRWFGLEFQLSAPIFILSDTLELDVDPNVFTVKSGDMTGVNFAVKLTFGKIADYR
jgi:hypothetical protein